MSACPNCTAAMTCAGCDLCVGTGFYPPEPNWQTKWATSNNPKGFFQEGTKIKIQGAEVKADNGVFVVTKPFPFQPMGLSYHQWIRLLPNGKPSIRRDSSQIRGGNAGKIAQWIKAGVMEIL